MKMNVMKEMKTIVMKLLAAQILQEVSNVNAMLAILEME